MTLALFFLGWFAVSLLLGAAWAGTATTRRGGVDDPRDDPRDDTSDACVPQRPEPDPGVRVHRSDAIVS
jgi:hypothetical protein